MVKSEFVTYLSEVIGVIYTIAWSISFWAQSYGIWKVKSARGLSINFLYLNFIGFSFYTIYNIYGKFDENSSFHNQTHLEDVIFAIHALTFVITIS